MTKRTFLIGGAALACLLALVKPAVLRTDHHAGLLVLLRWQSGTIRFVNSVTDRPVTFHFRVDGTFRHFSVATDETTEAYYTGGMYSMNEAVSGESIPVLGLCSVKGISMTIGFYDLHVTDGCLEVKLLWTI
jgi:hypothetical protein